MGTEHASDRVQDPTDSFVVVADHLATSALATSGDEAAPIGLGEIAKPPLGQLAKDRAVERRVGCLATGAGPVPFGGHRFDHLLYAERFGRFAKNLVRGQPRR